MEIERERERERYYMKMKKMERGKGEEIVFFSLSRSLNENSLSIQKVHFFVVVRGGKNR